MHPIRKSWFFLFYIWGIQWIVNGIIDFFNESSTLQTIKFMALLLAALTSLLLIGIMRSQIILLPQLTKQALQSYAMLYPLFTLFGSVVLLWYIAASDILLVTHVFRALLLAFFYVLLGALFVKELVWLGVWLFALVIVIGIWYLGYAPFVLEGMGGLSMLTAGWLLQRLYKE